MPAYGTYYIKGVLGATKWPRKLGVLAKEVVDVTILDVSIDQMVDWAAAIGAGRPKLAVQVLASLYNDSGWDTDNPPDIEKFIGIQEEELRKKGFKLDKTAPHVLLEPYHFAKNYNKMVLFKQITDPKIAEILETTFMAALVYGFNHPIEFKNWYKHNLDEFEAEKPKYEMIGSPVQDLPTLDELFSNAEDIITLYYQEYGAELPMPHPKLLAVAKKIRNK
jgi:hypothetical protein